jgi:hypothetical protein
MKGAQLEKAKAELRAALIGLMAAHAEEGDTFESLTATVDYVEDVAVVGFDASYAIEHREQFIAGGSL